MNEYQELRCDCGAFAKQVPAAKKLPDKLPGSKMRTIWWCESCKAYAEMERGTGKPTTGMGNPALHQMRARVHDRLAAKGMSEDGLRVAMKLKPWNFRFQFFTYDQCDQALKLIQQYKPPEQFNLEEELLS